MTRDEAVALLGQKLRYAAEEAAELPEPKSRLPIIWLSALQTNDLLEVLSRCVEVPDHTLT